jgi:hypothetical protein
MTRFLSGRAFAIACSFFVFTSATKSHAVEIIINFDNTRVSHQNSQSSPPMTVYPLFTVMPYVAQIPLLSVTHVKPAIFYKYNSQPYYNPKLNSGTTSISSGSVLTVSGNNFTSVPGPLPLLGVGVFFSFSRKLRQRIKVN